VTLLLVGSRLWERTEIVKTAVILPAAGLGTRMQRGVPPVQAETTGTSRKQFMLLEGAPILVHTVRKFVASPLVTDIVVAVREEEIDLVEEMLHKEGRGLLGSLRVVAGGNTRQESVEKAFGVRFRVGEVENAKNVGEFADLIIRRKLEP